MHCDEQGDTLWIAVSDTGIGIDPGQIEEIFREFHQIKTPGLNKEGFGLGLAIVKRLADLMDHEIRVESDVGAGSTFSVGVPIVSHQGHRSTAVDPSTAERPNELASGLIVLIEDDVKVANAWGLLLEAEGYAVATAASAKEAAAVAQHLESAPDLIISDFHLLDGSTGVEAVATVREAFGRNIPAFIVTGDTSKMVQEARSTENCVILNKPVDTDALLNAAHDAIGSGQVTES